MALYDPINAPKQIFKNLPYQDDAVKAVLDIFDGQPHQTGFRYRVDPGRTVAAQAEMYEAHGLRNEGLVLGDAKIFDNIQKIQRNAIASNMALTIDKGLTDAKGKVWYPDPARGAHSGSYNFDVEMETGTGKTYVYLKTMFEMNRLYGWSKFIIMVPSVAIREGVFKTIQDTSDHFHSLFQTRAKAFIYNSKHLDKLESFASNAGINIMVINTQAFAATGKDARRIYMELDDFNSRRPIDVIAANRPILILDEPQKMEGKKTVEGLAKFNPLFTLRYSATHATAHNTVHRLDALDAYNNRLVKKIAVRGITVRNLPGTSPFLHATRLQVRASHPPRIWINYERKQGTKIVRKGGWFERGDDIHQKSGGLEQYKGYTIKNIDATQELAEIGLGIELRVGEPQGDMTDETLRRIQIRETIRAHLATERRLFSRGIKVLSLFFIDSVANYRLYEGEETRGKYAQMFEEEYPLAVEEARDLFNDEAYNKYLARDTAVQIHEGYFARDKKGRMKDPDEISRGDLKGESKDTDAYDLILKNKARLLSFDEPVRFIFSHSALAEGWDNPNVFQICTLKPIPASERRVRQEVGRGLRLCVDQTGDRMDAQRLGKDGVHDINVLTVVAGESYEDFVASFQREVKESLHARPRVADMDYFKGKILPVEGGDDVEITADLAAEIFVYLKGNGYIDKAKHITERYTTSKAAGVLESLPDELVPHAEAIFALIDSILSGDDAYEVDNAAKRKDNPLVQDNFAKAEFQTLWNAINRKAVYQVDFDTHELIDNCVRGLDSRLHVRPMSYVVRSGSQQESLRQSNIDERTMFTGEMREDKSEYSAPKSVTGPAIKYDVIGQIAEASELKRNTVGAILSKISPKTFAMFGMNPEMFIAETGRIIEDEKGARVVAKITYDLLESRHEDADIFMPDSLPDGLTSAVEAKRHVYQYVRTDSKPERKFVSELEASDAVVVYAKLPSGFKIPTPVGNYNPDWAIAFKDGHMKHIYFVAETKGSLSKMNLRESEQAKIDCAKKFFERVQTPDVKYDVVSNFDELMNIVA